MNEWYNGQIIKFRLTISLGFLWAIFISSMSYALPQPDAVPSYPTRIFTDFSYFDTKANYDVGGGGYVGLNNGRYYRLIEGQVGIEHWLMNDFSVFAQMGAARAESYDGLYTRNNTAATDLLIGGRYVVTRSTINLVPEVWLSYPFNKFADDTDEVLTGDGEIKGFAGLFAELPFEYLRPFAEVGFLYQSGGLAALAVYELGLNWVPENFEIGGKIYGSSVAIKDDNSNQRALRDTVINRVDGGSYKFYSVDPSVLGLEGHIGFDLNQSFRLTASFDSTINGEASANGWTAKLGLTYFLPSDENDRNAPRVRSPEVLVPQSEVDRTFEPDQTDYDKSLFNEPKAKPKKKTKPVRKKVDVDKSLNDVQRSLEK